MKLLKSDLLKKLIIILIVLMIFNIAIPKEVRAATTWNFSGILMKPLTSLILTYLVSIDVQMGLFLSITDLALDGVGDVVAQVTKAAEDGTIDENDIVNGTSKQLKDIFIGPDTIFTGGVSILDANIFDPAIVSSTTSNEFKDVVLSGSGFSGTIKKGIATTYVVLRNICATIMLAGLIFTGIRVLITANNPQKKAQWLQLVYDWLVGMMLLIFSHVIMYGIFWISDTITNALSASLMGFGGLNFTLIKTCLLSFDSATQVVSLVMLGYLMYLTIVFAIAYFKRLLWVCVLIVISPIVSIMYAFGNQTKRIYTDWLREYITTVLVQPFHVIVYYTLVSVPLNMVSGSVGFGYSGNSTFTMIYALGAIAFIRPAESYIRKLFGMHQGIAAMASYDSGKQTFDAIVDAVKKIGQVVAIAATAGAAAPAMAGEMAGAEALGGAELANPMIGELNPDNLLADIPGKELYGEISRDPFHEDYFAGDANFDNDLQNPPLRGMNPMNEGELQGWLDNMGFDEGSEERAYMESDLRLAGHGNKLNDDQIQEQLNNMGLEEGSEEYEKYANKFRDNGHGNKWSEEQLQNELDNLGLERGSDERSDYERAFREAGHGDITEEVPENLPPYTPAPSDTMVDEYLQDIANKESEQKIDTTDKAKEDLKNRDLSNNINASHVNITASNITMQGKIDADKENIKDNSADKKDSTEEATQKLDKEKENAENDEKQKLDNEKNIGIDVKNNGEDVEETPRKDDFLDRGENKWNAIVDFIRGESSVMESINKISPDSLIRKVPQDIKNSQFIEDVKNGEHGEKAKKLEEFAENFDASVRKFDELGGFKEIYAGFNTIRDGFFVGGAPGDWKETSHRMEESRNANIEQVKYNVVNDEKNIINVINKMNLEEKLRAQYKDKEKYPDVRIREMAKDQAKEKVKSLSNTYVPLGVKDPVIMLELEDDRKKYGMTPTEVIQQREKYETFNIDQKNIKYVNEHLNVNATSVKQAVEPARDYYNNGYRDIGDLSRVHELTTLLRVTPEFGMKLDKVLNKKGPNININLDKRKDLDDKHKENIKKFLEKNYMNKGL